MLWTPTADFGVDDSADVGVSGSLIISGAHSRLFIEMLWE